DVVDGAETARAGHVADYDVRLAGNVPADMAGQEPTPQIGPAAGCIADDDVDVLAFVELGNGICARRLCYGERTRKYSAQRRNQSSHVGASRFKVSIRPAGTRLSSRDGHRPDRQQNKAIPPLSQGA